MEPLILNWTDSIMQHLYDIDLGGTIIEVEPCEEMITLLGLQKRWGYFNPHDVVALVIPDSVSSCCQECLLVLTTGLFWGKGLKSIYINFLDAEEWFCSQDIVVFKVGKRNYKIESKGINLAAFGVFYDCCKKEVQTLWRNELGELPRSGYRMHGFCFMSEERLLQNNLEQKPSAAKCFKVASERERDWALHCRLSANARNTEKLKKELDVIHGVNNKSVGGLLV